VCVCVWLCVSAESHWVLRLGRAEALWELFVLLDIDSQAPRDFPRVCVCVSVCVSEVVPRDPLSYLQLLFLLSLTAQSRQSRISECVCVCVCALSQAEAAERLWKWGLCVFSMRLCMSDRCVL